jgi:hypothetical protein
VSKTKKPYPNLRVLERLSGITWGDLTALEPRLGELLWAARQACVTCHRWSQVDQIFSPIRNTLAELVGFAGKNHGHPVLGSPRAYEIAYWKLYDAVAGLLPNRGVSSTESLERQRAEKDAQPPCPRSAAGASQGLE